MKKLLIALFAVSLSGCALVDAYFMAKYDTTEYALINSVKTKAQVAQETCNDTQVSKNKINDIHATAVEFRNYTFHLPRNEDATNMAGKLVALVGESKDHYAKTDKVSEFYCKQKLQQIVRSADTIQGPIGAKPR